MAKDRRERQRLKRANKRRSQHVRVTQQAQSAARRFRAAAVADEAGEQMQRGNFAEASRLAQAACTLAPRDGELANLWLNAAERSGDAYLQRDALEHYCGVADPDTGTLLKLAWLCRSTDHLEQAAKITARVGATLPR